ncbi:hypothetical protein [Methylomonas methanica]|uniref:Uncharacterized protein n=1 Tax=Methylomonas methanica (strain DSM 25384 / MC09) TaxID=857087 RepID=F9ZZB4_METMM|nr:hypothetical protein [Methylomonas methanica]AEG01140.1 hypothetical protein Metme_2758 [Methylomonas methanica MC09]
MIKNWSSLLEIFGTDDGSLPDIEIDNLSGDEVISGYDFIRNHAERISSKEPSYWSTSKDCDVTFKYEDNPACQVVSGEAESFHLCFDGLKSPSGKKIPELGLFVFSDCLSFDYRMGAQWDEQAVKGLFELILCLSKDYANMKICHRNNINDDDGTIFQSHWDAYKNA